MAPLPKSSAAGGGGERGGFFPDPRANGSDPILVPRHAELVGDPAGARFGARGTLEAAAGLLFFAFFLYAWRWCRHALAFEIPTTLPLSSREAAQAKRKQAREAGRKRKDSGLREVEMVAAADLLGPMPTLRGIADDTPCVLNQRQTRQCQGFIISNNKPQGGIVFPCRPQAVERRSQIIQVKRHPVRLTCHGCLLNQPWPGRQQLDKRHFSITR